MRVRRVMSVESAAVRHDVVRVARQACDLLGNVGRARGIDLYSMVDADVPDDLRSDPVRVRQVLTNLVSNAIHYNRPGGKVIITTGLNEGGATLSVTDTGIGMQAEAIPHIFDRFYRVDAARTRERGGSGLGLAICKGIIDAHGGTLEVTSKEGQGSTFTVRLPKA